MCGGPHKFNYQALQACACSSQTSYTSEHTILFVRFYIFELFFLGGGPGMCLSCMNTRNKMITEPFSFFFQIKWWTHLLIFSYHYQLCFHLIVSRSASSLDTVL